MFFAKNSSFGPLKTEFLICSTPCSGDCEREECPNKKMEVRLLEEVSFPLSETETLVVNGGFVFDGASIPQICWTSIGHPLEHRFIYAALLHDALYSAQLIPRKTADQYFQTFLREFSGVGWFTSWKMYTGVRLFGGIAWDGKTPEQIRTAQSLVHLKRIEA